MILFSNLPELRRRAQAAKTVLDVGGWHNPFNLATHVIDLMPHATRRSFEALDPEDAERFSAETWTVQDICDGPWPFADNSFDFVICSHTLEDVRDPVHVCREISRIGKAGYVEVPSRVREIFVKSRFVWWQRLRGRMPEVGFRHHRWYCEWIDGAIEFSAKTVQAAEDSRFFISRSDLGRKLTETESGLGLFFDNEIRARERVMLDSTEDLRAFRQKALQDLKSSKTES